MRLVGILASLLLSLPFTPIQAEPAPNGTVTLLEGKASVIRGTSRHALIEGVKLQPGDILELQEQSLAQVEFEDGDTLALGPLSRAMFMPYDAGARPSVSAEFFLLSGTTKIVSPKKALPLRLVAPLLAATIADATAVMRIAALETAIFAESGEIPVVVLASSFKLKSGEFYARSGDQKPTTASRPSQAFIAALPRSFLDPLPSRLAKYAKREIGLKNPQAFTYAEVEPWLKSTPAVRNALVPIWKSRASDPAFRKALIANLQYHPEWVRILYPDKNDRNPTGRPAD